MKKLIFSFLFLPSLAMGGHCDGGACPALEHIKDTGDEVAKDLLPYLGVGSNSCCGHEFRIGSELFIIYKF